MIRHNNYSFIDYLVMYLLIAVSGIVFFLFGVGGTLGAIALNVILIALYTLNNTIKVNSKVWGFIGIYFLVFLVLFFIQTIEVGFIPRISFSKYASKLFLAFTALLLLKDKFFNVYIKIMFVLGIVGLIIHALTFAIPPFFDFLMSSVVPQIPNQPSADVQIWHNYHIIIHNFWQRDLYRNSGTFWEPGANAGFTLLALFFNIYFFKAKVFTTKNLLFILVIISTLSTTGYIVLMMVLFLNPAYNKNIGLRIFSLLVVIGLAAFAFTKFDFMGSKVIDQMNNTKMGNAHQSRFASARLDFDTFVKHPFGFSNPDNRNGKKSDDDYRTNGVFIFLAAIGGIAFVLYFIQVYRGIRRVSLYFNPSANPNLIAFYFLVIILFLAFSENYFERPIFMAFSMLAPFFLTKTYMVAVPTII